jgi:hypothetical protein
MADILGCRDSTGVYVRYGHEFLSLRRPEKAMVQIVATRESAHCAICGRLLQNPEDPASVSCGGDCLHCMADCGDPECMTAIEALRSAGRI